MYEADAERAPDDITARDAAYASQCAAQPRSDWIERSPVNEVSAQDKQRLVRHRQSDDAEDQEDEKSESSVLCDPALQFGGLYFAFDPAVNLTRSVSAPTNPQVIQTCPLSIRRKYSSAFAESLLYKCQFPTP